MGTATSCSSRVLSGIIITVKAMVDDENDNEVGNDDEDIYKYPSGLKV